MQEGSPTARPDSEPGSDPAVLIPEADLRALAEPQRWPIVCIINVVGVPQPGGSKTAQPVYGKNGPVTFKTASGKTRVVTTTRDANKKVGGWKDMVHAAALGMVAEPLGGTICCQVVFRRVRPKAHFNARGELKASFRDVWPTVKPDATKYMRSTEDALSGVIWLDDNRVVMPQPVKRYCNPGEFPGARIIVRRMPEPDAAPLLR